MAKGKIIVPPKKSIAKNIKNIIKNGPRIQPSTTLSKGKLLSFVKNVQKSSNPAPSQNQRGKILSKASKDLTR